MGIDVLDEQKLQQAALVVENKTAQDITTQIIPVLVAGANGFVGTLKIGLDDSIKKGVQIGEDSLKSIIDDFFTRLEKFRDDTLKEVRTLTIKVG